MTAIFCFGCWLLRVWESVVRRANNNNDRSPTKTLGDDDCFCFLLFCLSSFPKEWPPAGLGNLVFVVAVILESRSPGSVVTQKETNDSFPNAPRRVLAGRLLPSGITLFLIVIPGVDPGSSLFIRKTPYFISGFQVPACMRALE